MKNILSWAFCLCLLLGLALPATALAISSQEEGEPTELVAQAESDSASVGESVAAGQSENDELVSDEPSEHAMSEKSKGFWLGVLSAGLLFCLFNNRKKLLAFVNKLTEKYKDMDDKPLNPEGVVLDSQNEETNVLAIEAPAEAPKEEPAEAPKEAPAEAPKEAPAEAPKEEPAEAPQEEPAEAPKEEPAEAPKEEPAEAPKEAPAEAPKEEPAEAPKEEPAEAPKEEPAEAPKEDSADEPKKESADEPKKEQKDAPAEKPKHPVVAAAFASPNEEWMVVGTSVIGNSHISMDLPCQDYNSYKYLGNGWGIAIVSDGAGSAKRSEIGSQLVVMRGLAHFEELIAKEGWMTADQLPSDAVWVQKAYCTLLLVYKDMEAFAKAKSLPVKDLSATAIVFIHTPFGALCTHIGDGRMGYRTASGEWKNAMNPHKGEEANQTIFITSAFWNVPNFVMSGVLVPESIVVREPITGFTLMSDGSEHTMWLCNQKDEATGKYYDPNLPYAPLYGNLCATLESMHADADDPKVCAESLSRFVKCGNRSFLNEPDDRTLILGVLCPLKK